MMWLIGAGFVGMAISFLLLAFVTTVTPYWFMGIGLFIFGLGLALVAVPQSAIFVSAAPSKYLGPVTSFRTTAGQLGYALGFAASAGLVGAFGQLELIGRLRQAGLSPSQLGGAVDQVLLYVSSGNEPTIQAAREAVATVANDYTHGFAVTMFICAIAMLLIGSIVILLLIIGRHQDREAAEREHEGASTQDAETGA
jgi:hypothetical protein